MKLEKYLENRYQSSSIGSYLHRIKCYQSYNKNHLRGSLQEVLNYLEVLRNKGKHPKTIRNYLHSIKIYYDYLQFTRKRADHPCKKLQLKDKLDKEIKLVNLYSTESLETYLQSTAAHKKLMVSLLVYQGLKASELVSLKVSQINIEKAQLHLDNRTLSLRGMQMPLLINHLSKIGSKEYLFTTKNGNTYPSSELNDYINKSRSKSDQITPLKIRQSVIKNLLDRHDIRVVQVFAGHKSSCTTAQYRASNLEALKKSIQNNHPLQ